MTSVCNIRTEADYTGVDIVYLQLETPLADYQQAMQLANAEAEKCLGDYMLLSWYDRDRDFESPQHSSECHADSAIPGYVDYGLYHGAKLKIDIEEGRFVFFYLPVEFD
ncbi:MAG: AF1514 family protein [Pseudomonadota bacterium]